MKKYNFDEVINRSETHCVKIEKLKVLFGREDLIPLWVADMDFASPPEITERLLERTRHGIFGYTIDYEGYYNAIIDWLKRKHRYDVKREEITFVAGIVKAIAFAIDTFTRENDKVIIQPPVYHPFRIVTESLGRKVANNPLVLKQEKYEMDFDGLKKIIAENDCKMLILCNPHNPGGRVWEREDLCRMADICFENNILVVSDEIHSDLTLAGCRHTPFATVSDKARANSITLMAPSKTFNIAGIVSSFAVIHNPEIRKKYWSYLQPRELNQGTVFAYTATEAAYREGEEWLMQAMAYVWDNYLFVDGYLKANIPKIKAMKPEASFLVWLDCRELELSQPDLVDLFVNKAKLALNDGTVFGREGTGFMRLNIGTPKSVLERAMDNLKKAVAQ